MRRIALSLLILSVSAVAQFGKISNGPLSGGCQPRTLGLDVVNNVLYSCGDSPANHWSPATGVVGVSSWNARTGAVLPLNGDYTYGQVTGAAPITSPNFLGIPTVPTQALTDNSTEAINSAWLRGFLTSNPGVASWNARSGVVVPLTGDYTVAQVTGAAPLVSPVFVTPFIDVATGTSLALSSGLTLTGAGLFNGTSTFNGNATFSGIDTFNVNGSSLFTIQNLTADACANLNSVNGGYTTTSALCAVTSSPVSGQVNSNIYEVSPRGWYWNTPNSGNPIAMYLNGNGNGLTLQNNADVELVLGATSGVVTNGFIKSVVSNGTAGETQFGFLNAATYWRFVAPGNNGEVFRMSAKAPTLSLQLTDAGLFVAQNGLCLSNAGMCWTSGAGAPGGSCVNGSLYTNTTGGAGTTTYECYGTGWHSIG